MKISYVSIFVDDQQRALQFYTDTLGFLKKSDIPMGEFSWLTLVSPGEPNGVELVLEPSNHRAVGPFRTALVADGIPFTAFTVDDAQSEYERLVALGVRFTQPPATHETMTVAVFDDTCGNLIQIVSDSKA
jgi:catechol 2,3-dioxygenase-like lactoylglutathione lyase family enzyme